MPITAIYFIPASQPASVLAELTDRLVRAYDPVQLGSWFLHHRLFRSLPTSTTDKAPPHSQHVLGVGHLPNRAFVHITGPTAQPQPDAPPPDSATTVAIPLAQMEPYSNLLNLKFGALWIYRFGSQVTNGVSYSLGEFTVRMGEVREKGGQMPPRGVVVCLQVAKQDPGDDAGAGAGDVADAGDAQQELEAGRAMLRDLWASFGPQGAKEAITSRVPGPADDDDFSEVQLWCEVLRFQK